MGLFDVYGDIFSGNCYKVKLLLSLLDIEHRWHHVDILRGETRTPEFLHNNPNGKIPVLVDRDGRCLFESNAILNYLANDTRFMPRDPFARAQVLQWQFFEQYSHEPYIATSRFIVRYLDSPPERAAELAAKRDGGDGALRVLDEALIQCEFLVGDDYSIADIALYAYSHVAEEGGFSLTAYPHVRRWLTRIASEPGHVTMEQYANASDD